MLIYERKCENEMHRKEVVKEIRQKWRTWTEYIVQNAYSYGLYVESSYASMRIECVIHHLNANTYD